MKKFAKAIMFRGSTFSKRSLRHQLPDISDVLHQNRCSLSKCAWLLEEKGKCDISVDSLLQVAESRVAMHFKTMLQYMRI